MSLARNLSIDSLANRTANHLYGQKPARGRGFRRVEQERPPLGILLAVSGALIVLPVLAAQSRVRAVEIVRV